jgi:hyperosmotically inducible protein
MKQIQLILSLFLLGVTSSGCVCLTTCLNPLDWYKIAVDERSITTQISDKTIDAEILTKFIDDETIKALDISAASYEGNVYLVGEYESEEQTKKAEEIVKSVEGVKSVTKYYLPKKELEDCGTSENVKLMAKVKAKLIEDGDIQSTNVDVKTVQCHAVLLGIVSTKEMVDKSINHAKSVEGIKGVKSFLNVVKRVVK